MLSNKGEHLAATNNGCSWHYVELKFRRDLTRISIYPFLDNLPSSFPTYKAQELTPVGLKFLRLPRNTSGPTTFFFQPVRTMEVEALEKRVRELEELLGLDVANAAPTAKDFDVVPLKKRLQDLDLGMLLQIPKERLVHLQEVLARVTLAQLLLDRTLICECSPDIAVFSRILRQLRTKR